MSLNTQQDLAATGSGQTPATERRSSQTPTNGRPAEGSDNLSEAALRAEFSQGRASRRGQGPAAPATRRDPANNATPQPGASTETPPDDAQEGDRSSDSASASTEGSTVEDLAQGGDDAASSQASSQQPASQDLDLDDPEAIEALTDDQIKAIKDSSTRKLVRRVHRLTARLREAEGRLAGRDEPKEQPQAPAPATGDRYDAHPVVAPIARKIADVEAALEWAEQNPDGGQFKGADGKVMEFSPEQVANILRRAPRELARLDTQRQVQVERLQAQESEVQRTAVETAKAAYPWLGNKDSEEYALASQVARNAPYIQQHPEWLLWLSDAVEGRKARLARVNGAQPPKARPAPPRIPTPAGSAAPRVDAAAKELAEAEAEFDRTGSEKALKRVMSLQRAARRR